MNKLASVELVDLDCVQGGQATAKSSTMGKIWKGAKTVGRKAGPWGAAAGAAIDGYTGYTNTKGSTMNKIAGGAKEAFHGATFGVFRSTPAY